MNLIPSRVVEILQRLRREELPAEEVEVLVDEALTLMRTWRERQEQTLDSALDALKRTCDVQLNREIEAVKEMERRGLEFTSAVFDAISTQGV